MQFEICATSSCETTKTIYGSKEFWTYKMAENEYQVLFIAWAAGNYPLGAGVNDDYFIVGNRFMEKYYTIFDYKNSKVGYIEAK